MRIGFVVLLSLLVFGCTPRGPRSAIAVPEKEADEPALVTTALSIEETCSREGLRDWSRSVAPLFNETIRDMQIITESGILTFPQVMDARAREERHGGIRPPDCVLEAHEILGEALGHYTLALEAAVAANAETARSELMISTKLLSEFAEISAALLEADD